MSKATEIFDKIPDLHYTETPPPISVEEFRKVILSRRSVRVFDGTPIPDSVMNECLDWALLSPNSSNLQPWEFYWIKTPEKKAKLIEYCLSQPAARTAAELIVCVARTKTWKMHAKQILEIFARAPGSVPDSAIAYYKKLVPMVYGQGPCGLFGVIKKLLFFTRGLFLPTPREPSSLADMRVWATKTVALGAQTLMLAFRAHGFDTCPIEGFDSARVRKLLALPCDAKVALVISAGKRAANGVYGPRIRMDRAQFIKVL